MESAFAWLLEGFGVNNERNVNAAAPLPQRGSDSFSLSKFSLGLICGVMSLLSVNRNEPFVSYVHSKRGREEKRVDNEFNNLRTNG